MKKITTILALLLFLSGCSNDSAFEGISDDSSHTAVIEEAAIAVDDRNYTSAINLLAEVYNTTSPDPRVTRLLSSAHMGRAGVDFVSLISFAGLEEREDFDMVAEYLDLYPAPELDDDDDVESLCDAESRTVLVFVDENDRNYDLYKNARFIDGHCIGDFIDNLEQAQYVLKVLIARDRHSPDDEIQLGVASAAHFVMITGNSVADAMNFTLAYNDVEDQKPGMIPVPIDKDAYLYYINFSGGVQYNWSRVDEGDFGGETNGPDVLNSYQEDLIDVYNAILAFDRATAEQNDVREALEFFLEFALLMPTTGIDESTIISTMTTSGVYDLVNSFSAD